MRGHLLALNTTMPLSILNESVGKPSIFHCLIRTGLPKVLVSVGLSLHGISLFQVLHPLLHLLVAIVGCKRTQVRHHTCAN